MELVREEWSEITELTANQTKLLLTKKGSVLTQVQNAALFK